MKYSEIIKLLSTSVQPDKEAIRNRVLKTKTSPLVKILSITAACAIIIAIILTGAYLGIMNIPLGNSNDLPERLVSISPIVSVKPTEATENIIDTNTEFKVTTSDSMSSDEFLSAFQIKPQADYNVTKTSGNTFTVTFDDELEVNTLYKISSISNEKEIYSWAFQTETVFEVAEHSPIDISSTTSSIEITFTHPDVEDFDQYFSIYPSIAGTFEHYGRKWVFIPSTEYQSDTLYTVTVSGDIIGNGTMLGSDYKFSFTPHSENTYAYISYNSENVFDSYLFDEVPAATIQYNNYDPSNAQVDVFAVTANTNLIDIVKEYSGKYSVSSSIEDKLSSYVNVISFTASAKSNNNISYIKYPQTFETGHYISRISFENVTLYHIFQITDMAVYALSVDSDYTFWVNDAITGESINGALVEILDFKSQSTDSNGLAVFTEAYSDADSLYYKVHNGQTTSYYGKIATSTKSENSFNDMYSCAIYSNSSLYHKDDIVKLWGFTMPKTSEAIVPDNMQLFCSWDNSYIDIDISDNGFFFHEIELSEKSYPEVCSVSLLNGNNTISTTEFMVDNSSSTYKVNVSTNQNAYYRTDEIEYTVKVTLADGTPANGIDVSVDTNDLIKTDETGIAKFTRTAKYNLVGKTNSVPDKFSTAFTVTEPDGRLATFNHTVAVFDTDLIITATPSLSQNAVAYDVTVNIIEPYMLNVNSIKNGNVFSEANSPKSYTGDSYDTYLTVEIHKVFYDKTEVSSVYDPVSDTDIKRYTYTETDEVVYSDTYETENGYVNIALPNEYYSDDARYYVRFYTDGRVYGTPYTNCYNFNNSFEFSEIFDYTLETDKNEYAVNDTVHTKLYDNISGEFVSSGTVLLSFIGSEPYENEIYVSPENFNFTYKSSYGEEIEIVGAYFDGRNIKFIEPKKLSSEAQNIFVKVSSDKDKYLPGENVTLTIDVTDENDTPINAQLYISVTDSALTSIADAPIAETETEFSRKTSSYTPQIFTEEIIDGSIATKKVNALDFESAIHFEATTANRGAAAVTFTLPDTVNEWNVTVTAVNDEAAVASRQTNIIATKPLYFEITEINNIKSTDDTVISFGIYGEDVIEEEGTYSVLLNDELISSNSTDLNSYISENLGKLACGNYSLTLQASYNGQTTTTEYSFTVEESLSKDITTSKSSVDSFIPNNSIYTSDVTINLYDQEYDIYFSVIEKLAEFNGNKIEQQIAQKRALSYLTSEPDRYELNSFVSALDVDLFTDDSYDTLLRSAKASAVIGKMFDEDIQKSYFYNIIKFNPTTYKSIYAYLGLAALGEPVLNDLSEIRSDIETLSDEEILYLALAYSYAGDRKSAEEIYSENILGNLRTVNGVTTYYAETSYDTANLTSLAAFAASSISATEAKDLVKGILNNNSTAVDYSLELLAFIENCIPSLEGENTVTITYADGSSENISFLRTHSASVTVSKEDYEKIKFSTVSGSVMVMASGYTSTSNIVSGYNVEANGISIDAEDVEVGELTDITISLTVAEGQTNQQSVYIELPYALKLISIDASDGTYYCASQDKRSIKAGLNGNTSELTLTCYTISNGEFCIEPITVINSTKETYSTSLPYMITVE